MMTANFLFLEGEWATSLILTMMHIYNWDNKCGTVTKSLQKHEMSCKAECRKKSVCV